MKHIDLEAIATSPGARLKFLRGFIGFSDDDWETLRGSVVLLAPYLPAFLDAIYDHLLSYDDTRKVFLGRDGQLDPTYLAIRKEHLTEWFLETASAGGNPEGFANYLMKLGEMHTASQGDPHRAVPPRYMVAMVGYIQSLLTVTIQKALPFELEESRTLSLAWNKMMILQLEFLLKSIAPEWPAWDERGRDA